MVFPHKKTLFPLEHLDYPFYPDSLLETLFNYILLDDVPHYDVSLPTQAIIRCEPQEIIALYRLSWQLLMRGVDLKEFRYLVMKIAFTGKASDGERKKIKDVRARFKHMCFIRANTDRRHRYPLLLKMIRILTGKMQDAFKTGERIHTFFYGLILRLTLSSFFYKAAMKQLLAFSPATPDDLMAYQQEENADLNRRLSSMEAHTGHEFHQIRKIISRRVAFNDTLRTLRPDAALNQLSQYLATINGMMGDKHDDFVEKKLKGDLDYKKDRFKISQDITKRLKAFITQCRHNDND